MNKDTMMGLGILIIVIGLLFYSIFAMIGWDKEKETITPSNDVLVSLTRTSSGEVSVDLTPTTFENGLLYITISVDTHTINNLNTYNLTENVELLYKGKTYKPVNAPSLQGHHSVGELVFKLEEEPKEFTIIMYQLHDIETREFVWR